MKLKLFFYYSNNAGVWLPTVLYVEPFDPSVNFFGQRFTDQHSHTLWSCIAFTDEDSFKHVFKENEPIQQALLERTPANLNNEAVLMHLAILKHSGDYVSRKPDFATEITDQIFMAPLKETGQVFLSNRN